MFFAGDEFLNTQYGNNNAYCQDNEISWLDWRDSEKNRKHFEFCKYMIAFRKAHPVLRKFSGNSENGFPETLVWGIDNNTKVLRIIFAGRNAQNTADDIICLAINTFWEDQECILPSLRVGQSWYITADTSGRYLPSYIPEKQGLEKLEGNTIRVPVRSVCVLIAKAME